MVPIMGLITKCHFISGPGVPLPTKDALGQHADLIHRTRAGNGSQMFPGNAEGKAFFPRVDCWHIL